MIKDRNIHYKYQSLYFPAAAFDKVDDGTSGQDAGAGDDNFEEVATTGFMAWQFAGGDDQIHVSMVTPTNIDWDNDVFYRVIWAAASGGASVETFLLKADEVAFGTAPKVAVADVDSLTAFATLTDTPSAINVPLATPWGKADSSTSGGIAGTTDVLRIFVDCSTDDTSTNDPRLIGLEIQYLPKLTDGAQNKLTDDPTDA
jgi:hypothetical protein